MTDRLQIQNNPINERIEVNELNELSEHFVSNPRKITVSQKIQHELDFDRRVG
jgi:hypothetical protein